MCVKKFGTADELCLLLPTPKTAQACRAYLLAHSPPSGPVPTRIVEFVICPDGNPPSSPNEDDEGCLELQIILFPKQHWPLAKSFWQHTGLGISSRRAERGLALYGDDKIRAVLGDDEAEQTNGNAVEAVTMDASPKSTGSPPDTPAVAPAPTKMSYSRNRHYSRAGTTPSTSIPGAAALSSAAVPKAADALTPDHMQFVEQRYGRNLPVASAATAKLALRRRIAGVLEGEEIAGGRGVTETDVWLHPTGMAAIWTAHQACLAIRKGDEKKSVVFGYVDHFRLACCEGVRAARLTKCLLPLSCQLPLCRYAQGV